MKKAIKKRVVELLESEGKLCLYSDKDFNGYYRKFNRGGSNPTWLAVRIYDCFLINAPMVQPQLIIELV
jgi:hypothetical protein